MTKLINQNVLYLVAALLWCLGGICMFCSCRPVKKTQHSTVAEASMVSSTDSIRVLKGKRENNISEQWVRETFQLPDWLFHLPAVIDTVHLTDTVYKYKPTLSVPPIIYTRETGSRIDLSTSEHSDSLHRQTRDTVRQVVTITKTTTKTGWPWYVWVIIGAGATIAIGLCRKYFPTLIAKLA